MMWKIGEYEVHPTLERAMDVLFILHADHEQNCGTTANTVWASSNADPYSAAAAAAAALYGPLHGGANEAVVRMLTEIGTSRPGAGVRRRRQGGQRPADGLRASRRQE